MSFGKMFSAFFVLAAFCHCMSNQGLSSLASADLNVKHFSMLSLGMSQKEVLQIMRKPHSYESFEIKGDIYDVWFYVVSPTVLGQSRMVAQNLTPVAFKNGKLLGWGYRFYNHFVEETAKAKTEAKEKDTPLAMSTKKSKTPPKTDDQEDQAPPDDEGREMIRDDAEDDFNTW